jgi:hypothetical protein
MDLSVDSPAESVRFRFLGRAEGVVMIAKNWMKWAAGTVTAAIVLAAMPAVGQARTYTGRTPASIASSSARHSTKLVVHHKKHTKKHGKRHSLTSKSRHASKMSKIKA